MADRDISRAQTASILGILTGAGSGPTAIAKPTGFAGFFKNYGSAQEAIARAAENGEQLAGSIGNVADITGKLTSEALAYNTPGRQDAAASRAATEVRTSIDRNKAAGDRQMLRMGVNPNSGRYAGDSTEQVASALAQVSAGNTARKQVEDTGQSRLKEALAANTGAALLGLSLDGSVIDSAYKTILSDRQNELNAAQLSLNKYSVDKGIQYNNQKLQAQSDAANGQMWGNALNLGLSVLKDTGALGSIGNAVSNWWNS